MQSVYICKNPPGKHRAASGKLCIVLCTPLKLSDSDLMARVGGGRVESESVMASKLSYNSVGYR